MRPTPPTEFTTDQIAADPILGYFGYAHLPFPLQEISSAFCSLAAFMVEAIPRSAERSAGLRKLLEAKDCAVRANVGNAREETFFDRLVAERKQLDDRYTKLSNFLCTAQYEEMPRVEQNDLANQANVMLSYRNILDARISRNAPKPAFVDPEIRTTARQFDEDGVRTLGDDKSEEPVPFK